MSNTWLEHLLTEEEQRTFAEQGYMVVEDAIPFGIGGAGHAGSGPAYGGGEGKARIGTF